MSINTKSDMKAAIIKELMLTNWSVDKIKAILARTESDGMDYYHNKVIGLLSEIFNMPIDKIKSKSRKPVVVIARCCFIKYMTERFGYGSSEIGRMINKGHAAVIHHKKNFNSLLETEDLKAVNAWSMFQSRIHEIEN